MYKAVLTRCNRLLEVLDGLFLTLIAAVLLVVKPAQLLENFGVIGIMIEDSLVCGLRTVELYDRQLQSRSRVG